VSAFAEAGASEIIAGTRTREDRERLSLESSDFTTTIHPVQLDVTRDEEVDQVKALGPVDILVNNAGVAGFGNPLEMNFDDIRNEIEVNYLGALRVSRAIIPAMMSRRDGMVVNVATAFAKINLPIVGTYCATKAALLSLGQALRAYLADHNVRVITVMPTTIDTDMSKHADVPKMTKEFVASEILQAIHDEPHDPPIGDEARSILEGVVKDEVGLQKMLANFKAQPHA
jgi:short-subunit dehydrogenase